MVTTKVLTSFLPLEPDVRMFTGWDEYKEMNLSGLKGAIAKGIGLTPEKCPNCYTPEVKGDETYAEWNKQ